MTRAAAANARAGHDASPRRGSTLIVESPRWNRRAGAEAAVRRALIEAAVAAGVDFKDRRSSPCC